MRFRSIFASRTTHWIAILAVLLSALSPTLTHALAARSPAPGGLPWGDLCLAGDRGVPDRRAGDPERPAPRASAHCPYCLTHAGSFGLPAMPVAAGDAPAARPPVVAACGAAPVDAVAITTPPARGPPRLG